ncbi:MAG: hypothetical protein ABEJ72_05700, partial [Candidatus Aenigmatarchaeota archaeon]
MRKISSVIAVGLESTLDVLITFPSLDAFEDFSEKHEGTLSNHVKNAYEVVSSSRGGEVPIDGNKEEAQRLVEEAKEEGAKIDYNLGGNAAQESVSLKRLDNDPVYIGGIFPQQITKL